MCETYHFPFGQWSTFNVGKLHFYVEITLWGKSLINPKFPSSQNKIQQTSLKHDENHQAISFNHKNHGEIPQQKLPGWP